MRIIAASLLTCFFFSSKYSAHKLFRLNRRLKYYGGYTRNHFDYNDRSSPE